MATLTLTCPNNLEGACSGWLSAHTYDLGGVVQVSRIIWDITFSGKSVGVDYTYEVRVSLDNANWTTVHSFINNSPYPIVLDLSINNNARYLKLIKTSSNYMGFIDGSSVTVTYSGTEPPPPTCINGTLRAPYWCVNGTEIQREVCQNNQWVDSGQVCPKICDVGDSYCEVDNTLRVCVAHDQWDNWWDTPGQPCECASDGCVAGVECAYGPYQSCCTLECSGGRLVPHQCAECYDCVEGSMQGPALCPNGDTIYQEVCVDHHWAASGMECVTPECIVPKYIDCYGGSQVMTHDCVGGAYVPTGYVCPTPPLDLKVVAIGGAAILAGLFVLGRFR